MSMFNSFGVTGLGMGFTSPFDFGGNGSAPTMPAAFGLTERAVREVGVEKAIASAQHVANKKQRPCIVPIPGTGKSKVVRPQKRKPAFSFAFVPKRKPIVLPAKIHRPVDVPNRNQTARGPLGPNQVKAILALQKRTSRIESAAARQAESHVERRATREHVPARRVGPKARGGGLSTKGAMHPATMRARDTLRSVQPKIHHDLKEEMVFLMKHDDLVGVSMLCQTMQHLRNGNQRAAAASYKLFENYARKRYPRG